MEPPRNPKINFALNEKSIAQISKDPAKLLTLLEKFFIMPGNDLSIKGIDWNLLLSAQFKELRHIVNTDSNNYKPQFFMIRIEESIVTDIDLETELKNIPSQGIADAIMLVSNRVTPSELQKITGIVYDDLDPYKYASVKKYLFSLFLHFLHFAVKRNSKTGEIKNQINFLKNKIFSQYYKKNAFRVGENNDSESTLNNPENELSKTINKKMDIKTLFKAKRGKINKLKRDMTTEGDTLENFFHSCYIMRTIIYNLQNLFEKNDSIDTKMEFDVEPEIIKTNFRMKMCYDQINNNSSPKLKIFKTISQNLLETREFFHELAYNEECHTRIDLKKIDSTQQNLMSMESELKIPLITFLMKNEPKYREFLTFENNKFSIEWPEKYKKIYAIEESNENPLPIMPQESGPQESEPQESGPQESEPQEESDSIREESPDNNVELNNNKNDNKDEDDNNSKVLVRILDDELKKDDMSVQEANILVSKMNQLNKINEIKLGNKYIFDDLSRNLDALNIERPKCFEKLAEAINFFNKVYKNIGKVMPADKLNERKIIKMKSIREKSRKRITDDPESKTKKRRFRRNK